MESRAATRLEFARRLYRLGYDAVTIAKLDRLVEWLLWLPSELKEQTWQGIQEIRKEYKMPFVTYGETKAEAKGEVKGLRAGIDVVLDLRFDQAADDIKQAIASIQDPDVLQHVLDVLKTAQTLDEVQAVYRIQQS